MILVLSLNLNTAGPPGIIRELNCNGFSISESKESAFIEILDRPF